MDELLSYTVIIIDSVLSVYNIKHIIHAHIDSVKRRQPAYKQNFFVCVCIYIRVNHRMSYVARRPLYTSLYNITIILIVVLILYHANKIVFTKSTIHIYIHNTHTHRNEQIIIIYGCFHIHTHIHKRM